MATRVFLLSGDEKAVHAITQILDELEISFEHSSDSAFSLKRLAAHRFDLLIVDCDNAQTATQVFNSARSSALNRGAIAVAIVEGKAGVPNAFRLGASLVLTKPVSLEQVRNTLRTGIGMTRKDGPERQAPAPMPAAASISIPSAAAHPLTPPPLPTPISIAPPVPPIHPHPPQTPSPATPVATTQAAPAASAQPVASAAPRIQEPPAVPSASSAIPSAADHLETGTAKVSSQPTPADKPATVVAHPAGKPAMSDTPVAFPSTQPAAPKPPAPPVVSQKSSAGAAAAPALAKSDSAPAPSAGPVQKTHEKTLVSKPFKESDSAPLELLGGLDSAEVEDSPVSLRAQAVPAFGGLNKQPFAGMAPPKRSRAGLILRVVLLLLIAGCSAAWFLKPQFRSAVLWEYGQVKARVAAWRGQTAPPAQTPKPAVPASVVPATPASTRIPADVSAAQPASAVGTTNPATEGPAAPNAPASLPHSAESPASPPSVSSDRAPDKNTKASIPTVKQDRPSAQPAAGRNLLSASAATVPGSKVGQPELYEVPEDYADDQVIHRVHPVYPKQARAKKLHGTVVLQAIIDKKGRVNSLQLVSGDPILAQAAADAVKQWRYKPYSHNGDPSDFQTRVTVDFRAP
jgi:protein TonB